MVEGKYRLVTRSDFDGLVCAVLLKELELIGDITFVHPKDMQDGKIEVTEHDITTNLPYVERVYLAFDHHYSETIRVQEGRKNHILDPEAPSTARVVYDYYGGGKKFPDISDEMMTAVDKSDSGQFTEQDIVNPQEWVLLNYIMDPRTGLGRFRNFRIPNYDFMVTLVDYCKSYRIEHILNVPDVHERARLYFAHERKFKAQIQRRAAVHRNLVVLDLRHEETIYAGNRFMIYALFPQSNISIHVMWGKNRENTVFAIGKSVLNRTSKTNIGELVLQYEGGGHANAGTCQIENDQADDILERLIKRITTDG